MPIYERAPDEVVAQMRRQLDAHHPGLRDAGVKVDVVFAKSKKDEHGHALGPALKHGGYVVAGYAKILNLKDRVMGRGDAEIVLDGDRWDEWGEAKQNALLDHELNHFELVSLGSLVVRDDANRPKLKVRLHDYNFGWFTCIAERHGPASFECEQAEQIFTENGQLLFPFAAGVSRVERAEAFLAGGKKGGGVESVTLSSGGRSVTLTAEHRRKADAMLKKERDRSPRGMKSIAKDLAGGAASMPPA